MNSFVDLLHKQSFQPNFLSLFINPFYFIRRGLYRKIKKNSTALHGVMLDFGCGRKPYRNLFSVHQYVGVDIQVSGHSHENSQVDVFYDGKKLPFSDEHFDSFFCSEVVEHIFNPDQIMTELVRVLKKGATGIITIPFAWPEHEKPFDFARYTSFGFTSMLERHGFRILSIEKSGHFSESLIQMTTLYIYTLFQRKSKVWNTLCTLLFISPINLSGAIISAILPRNRDLFHNLVLVVEKPA